MPAAVKPQLPPTFHGKMDGTTVSRFVCEVLVCLICNYTKPNELLVYECTPKPVVATWVYIPLVGGPLQAAV